MSACLTHVRSDSAPIAELLGDPLDRARARCPAPCGAGAPSGPPGPSPPREYRRVGRLPRRHLLWHDSILVSKVRSLQRTQGGSHRRCSTGRSRPGRWCRRPQDSLRCLFDRGARKRSGPRNTQGTTRGQLTRPRCHVVHAFPGVRHALPSVLLVNTTDRWLVFADPAGYWMLSRLLRRPLDDALDGHVRDPARVGDLAQGGPGAVRLTDRCVSLARSDVGVLGRGSGPASRRFSCFDSGLRGCRHLAALSRRSG